MLFSNTQKTPNLNTKSEVQHQFLIGYEANTKVEPMGFGFSKDVGVAEKALQPIVVPDDGHMMTIAPTGAGKGVSCIIPALLTSDCPMIVVDPKGENAIVSAQWRKEMGHDVHIIDPMGITGLNPSRFNPMDLICSNCIDGVDNAAMLASQIVPAYAKDPFWSNRAIQLIIGLMMYVVNHEGRSEQNLVAVRSLLNQATECPAEISDHLSFSKQEEVAAVSAMLKQGNSNLTQSILSVASDAMDVFRGEQVKRSIYASSFDLSDITKGKDITIYLVLPPHMLKSHGALLRLWITSLFAAISRRQSRPKKSTLFLMDEAAQLGEFEPLRSAVTLMRGYGLRTWTFWQDASQITRLYQDWPTLISNCRAIQVFGRFSASSALPISQMLNLATPDCLTDLEQDEMLYLVAGEEAVLVKRLNYLEDEVLRSRSRPNRLHDAGAAIDLSARPIIYVPDLDLTTEQMELFRDEETFRTKPKFPSRLKKRIRSRQ